MAAQDDAPETRRVPQYDFYQLLRRADLPFTTKGVALFYASYASPDGRNIFPRQERMVWETGLKDRPLREHLSSLRRLGLLTQIRAHSPGRSAEYALSWPVNLNLVAMRLDPDGELLIPLPVVKARGGKHRRPDAAVAPADGQSQRRGDAGVDAAQDAEHRRPDAAVDPAGDPSHRRPDAGEGEPADPSQRRPDAAVEPVDNSEHRRPDAAVDDDPQGSQRRGDATYTGVPTPSHRRGGTAYLSYQSSTETTTPFITKPGHLPGDENGHSKSKIDFSHDHPPGETVTDEEYAAARRVLDPLPDSGAVLVNAARAAYATNGYPNAPLRHVIALAATFATTTREQKGGR